MKQFLHASTLRPRLASAALALAFGLLAAPPAAAAPSFMITELPLSANDDPQMVSFQCDPADLVQGAAAMAYVPNANIVKLYAVNATTGERALSGGPSVTIPMTMVFGSFFVEPVSPGTVTLTVTLGGATATLPITVSEPDNIVFTRAGSTVLYYPEGGQQTLHLDFGYNLPQTVTFQIQSTDDGSHVTFDQATLVAPMRSSGADFAFNALDGANPSSVTFTFTGDTAYQGGASATVMITNVPPVLQYPSRDPDKPTPIQALAGAPFNFNATATDASSVDRESLVYNWSNSADTGPNVSARVSANDEIITVTASDKDGGTSETGYFKVELLESSKIKFTDDCTIAGITARGGNGPADFVINPATTHTDDASNPWDELAGNDFKADSGTMVAPVIPDGYYPFGWMFDAELCSSQDSLADLWIPNLNANPILIKTPGAGGVATVRYFSSRPYFPYDDFGDFDQDGLSDEWESHYLDADKEQGSRTFANWENLAVTRATGEYGASGTHWDGDGTWNNFYDTPDNDRIPTREYEEIENVWTTDPHYDPTDGMVNLVRVFKYPLTGDYVDYGTHTVGEGGGSIVTISGITSYEAINKQATATKPFFSNILEFRGLPQSASEDKDHPVWRSYGYPGIIAVGTPGESDQIVGNVALRGNCPATDPTVADSDGDIKEDGWEYYFWSTILYENKPEFWRAFDPTFTLYPNLAPGGGADFKATGLPLLRRNLEGFEAEYDGGLFVRYADQTFEPELIRDECYYGSPNLDPTTRSSDKNSLTNTPIASVAYYEDPLAEEPTPAVVFHMGGLEIYTRDGHVDALGRAKLFYKPRPKPDYEDMNGPHPGYNGQEGTYPSAMIGELEPGEISGAYVDFLSGQFFLPGYDYFSSDIRDIIGSRDATLTATYRTVNGLFPKSWLLSQFDPMDPLVGLWGDKWEGYPDFAAILNALGINPGQWDCTSDLDGDGLSNYEEYFLGTNPMHWDTDNDGMPDGWEVLFELDPHNPRDATENPDGDVMYTSGGYRHCDAFLFDYFNDTFWNGQTSLGFLPGAGAHSSPVGNFNIPFTSREEFYVQKWMIGKDDSGNYPMFVNAVYPSMWWDYNRMQPIKSLNPRSDDSNEDHIPDGWALYTGYRPAGSIDLIDYVWAPFYALPMYCPAPLRPDPDDKRGDGLGWLDEFENWTMFNTRSNQIVNGVYVEENQMAGHYHPETWYQPRRADWTNKTYPTDPWHGDTDGDGISDPGEYQESGGDNNGDGLPLLNFNPCSADTRLNRLGDAWNYASGLYDTVNAARADLDGEFGPYGDPDRDGLPNYQEYLTTAVYGWRYDYWYSPDNEELWVPFGEYQRPYSMKDDDLQAQMASDRYIAANYSMDPIPGSGERLYDVGDTITPPVPMPTDAYPYGKSVHFQPYRASDFFRGRPSSKRINDILSTVVRLERRWTNEITHTFHVLGDPEYLPNGDPNIVEVPLTAGGWDETFSPTLNDLEKAQADPQFKVSVIANYMQRIYALTHDRLGRFMLEKDPVTGELKSTAFISLDEYFTLYNGYPSAELDLRDYMFSYGIYPAPWESRDVQIVDDAIPVIWAFAPPGNPFPSCLPRDPDSDHDGMDDYWEIYHGLNPLYGGSPSIGGAGSFPDADRADRHPDGLGSTRDWYMQPNPAYVRVLTGGYAISREPRAFANLLGYEMEAAHYDYRTRPWLAGDRFADPDQDGLANQEESYNYLLNDVLHHTDPSPYWFTDPSYAESYVNLYYKVDGELGVTYWWWDKDLMDTDGDGPTYLFDFEIGEGFDTDNDNIPDSIELTQDDNNGVTDPLDLDSPRKRKALYFDGNAAARTRNPYYHDKFTLTSYTVEFWVRPQELPAPGKRMTLVQRPVLMPVDDSSGATHWDIRNTFLVQLDDLGRVHARVDNDARETVASATTVSAGRLAPDKWSHVAVVMDSVKDRLELYINGEYAAGVGAGLKPCTGGLFGFQYQSPVGLEGRWESANLYDYSPAPIVLGAYDRNPWGIVGGVYDTYPWGTMNAGLSSIAGQYEPDFDPEQYFVGWMDEVRIWDRCRTQTELKNDMMKRFTAADIEAVNRTRLAWELKDWENQDPQIDRIGTNLVAATQMSDWPQKLLYHYSFDNLPDVMAARDRDTSFMQFFTADADPFPAGWQSETVSAYRPNPFWTAPMWYHYRSLVFPHLVPWWYAAQHRSNLYTDYSYVPWIENTVAHMPQTPALDMKGLFPNWDPGHWTVTSYRYRAAMDWMIDALGPLDFVPHRQDDVVPAALPATGSTDVTLDRIRNSMNPYVMFYRTAVTIVDETAPNQFAGKLDRYGRYTGIPVLSDMLPLMDAVADIDVPMWDGKGRGTELDAVDTDGDGLPDWWEIVHGLDPNSDTGRNGAYGDEDNDGLDNWAEYLAHTDPFRYDTDSDGYSDYYSRPDSQSLTYGEMYDDGDGMDNAWEILHGLNPNRYDATDDTDGDGWTNWEEFMANTMPEYADQFPKPAFNVEFFYSGEKWNGIEGAAAPTFVQSYGEKTAGRNMGGWFDGRYRSYTQETNLKPLNSDDEAILESLGLTWTRRIAGEDKIFTPYDVSYYNYGWDAWNNPFASTNITGNYIFKLKNEHIGAATVIFSAGNVGYGTAQVKDYKKDAEFGVVAEDTALNSLIVIDRARGLIYTQNAWVYAIEYSVGGRSFPILSKGMSPVGVNATHDHMVSGWNRFLGWLDLDGNSEWTPDEPMGLSTPRPTLVSWDSVETTIPLSDSIWDYPRLMWAAPTNVPGIGEMTYFVDFSWVRGQSTGSETETVGGGNSNYGKTGDWDSDGLEDWMEVLAGTATNSVAGDPNDYYSIDPVSGFSYGELYDDGDGIPTVWELKYGLDPYRYDAKGDPDDDGWSNYAEFMAGTDPTVASDYPHPRLAATFYYHGQETDLNCLGVYSYGQKTQGSTWGGSYDGRYTSTKGFTDGVYLGSDGSVTLDKYSDAGAEGTFAVNKLRHGLIESASIDVYVEGADGAMEVRTFTMQQINPGMGLFTQDDLGWILISIESGQVLSTGSYVGKLADVHTTVKTYSFPVTFTDLIRNPEGNHTHMVEGSNRFLGWMDLDGNQTYDQGEPMGIALYSPTLVGWDSTAFEIPLTDSLWDYPRISWNATGASSTNQAEDLTGEAAGTNSGVEESERTYYVNFAWVRGASTRTDTETTGGGNSYYGTTGDWDNDGLEDWMEVLAGTATNSVAGDPNDYYSIDPVSGFAYGELYDDGDGIPTAWELRYGLDPYRYDAKGDKDDDGWSNYAEFMAGTNPTDAGSYPKPKISATFYYHGEQADLSGLGVYTYGQKTQGSTWGGAFDGRYFSAKNFSYGIVLGSDGTVTYDVSDSGFSGTFNYNALDHGLVETASIDVFLKGADGETEVRQFQLSADASSGAAVFTQDETGWICMDRETGRILVTEGYVGQKATVSISVRSFAFPVTFNDLVRTPDGTRTHMVEGPNRFFGWMDLDGNQTYDQGEPSGLGLSAPTLVGWDSAAVEIPLTDSLWDYPRVSWNDFVPSNFTPRVYIVTFTAEGKTSIGEGSTKTLGIYGDLDGDGLDAWMESQADTILNNMDSDGDGRMDYDSTAGGALTGTSTWGELLDDGDGMPAQWEIAYGIEPYYDLNPHLFDADGDLDDDGWSNWAEFMANTNPANPDSFPEPNLSVTFRYDGEVDGASKIKVFTYSEKVEGSNLAEDPKPDTIYMGGQRDGLYMTQSKSVGVWGDASLKYDALNTDWGASFIGGRGIVSATLVWFGVDGTEHKQDMQSFASDPNYGYFLDDGTARIFIEKSTGMILTQFYEKDLDASSVEGDELGGGSGVGVQTARSSVYAPNYTVEYSVAGKDYPMTIPHLSRGDTLSKHNHMMEGYNRFLAFMDMNANDEWDESEPLGLSLYDATLVGYDSAVAEIPLTDGLFGFERIKWPSDPTQWVDAAETNKWGTHYKIVIKDGNGKAMPALFVETPRNFLHEGDYVEAAYTTKNGKRVLDSTTCGLQFNSTNDLFTYKVTAHDGASTKLVAEGSFRHVSGPAGGRRATAPIYPVAGNIVHGSLVEFQWKMDSRTQGVKFTVTKTDGADAGVKIDNVYVPFPVRHNKVNDDDYYYSYIPQLKDGRTLVEFPDGNYSYTITPVLHVSTSLIPSSDKSLKAISGSFKMERGPDQSRDHASISGNVHYYGRMANANGVFATGNLIVQAYKLPDDATTSIQISGNPIAKQVLTTLKTNAETNFTLNGLSPGCYAVIAFVDVNANGIADIGETQGLGFLGLDRPSSAKGGGSAIPIQLPEWFSPIEIRVGGDSSSAGATAFASAIDVTDVHIVLRDRDLNGDKLPELAKAAGVSLENYKDRELRTFPSTKVGIATNWPTLYWFDKSFHPVSSRSTPGSSSYDKGNSVQFAVKAPRKFLHEGDLARTGLYGFNLGENNALNITWDVVATDGYHSQTNEGGTFSVYAGLPYGTEGDPDPRRKLKARWPTQNTVVHGSVVDFEWEMDFRTAGIDFLLERKTGDAWTVVTNMTIPFPVLHWDPTVQNYYYVARPQMEDGLRFLELPDGAYRYTITERTNTDAVPSQEPIIETFQIRNDKNTRTTGSIGGDVWYYGRSTVPGTTPPQWKNDLRIQAYKVSDSAISSASVGGQIVAESIQKNNGAYRLEGIKAGTYSVFAFVDSNGNGVADDWETQGFGFYGGNASPVVIPTAAIPIVVTNGASVTDVNIVLHDRDTDGDLLPDVWEWEQYGDLAAHNGYEAGPSNAYTSLTLPDPSILTNWTWKIDMSKVVTHIVDIPETDGLRVRIDNPRTFLHEGDLTVPYRLKNPAEADVEDNRIYHLWQRGELADGSMGWIPRSAPYYGFYLGSYSNALVSYTVESTDGMDLEEVDKGSFKVIGKVGSEREPVVLRYPTQNTPVHGSAVEFEWKMDNHNAGVVFNLWKLSGAEEGAAREQIVENLVVPFPVRHWDPQVKCYYFTAKPQMEDGLRFLELEDGFYEYSITERPQTDLVEPQTKTERFQLRNAENTRTTGSIEGDVRYYGRSTVPGSDPPEWASDLHVQAYQVSEAATSSAFVGGQIVAESVQKTNGAFRLEGLKAGTYSVFAFVDSNGNGVADDWETQGFGFYGGNASPVVIPSAAVPIVVTNGASVIGVNIVLHDRDTDGDKLPDVWEYETYGSLATQTGYDAAASNAYTSLTLSDPSILTNWIWKIDTSTIVTHTVDIPEKDSLRVRVDGPRTFLHEGDFLTPWVYVNKKKGLVAEGVPEKTSNIDYYLWSKNEEGAWVPKNDPYYGFFLGSYSNIVVNWSVSAWDGAASMSLTGGAFRVVARVGGVRKPLLARYPTQGTPVRGNVVEFEWEMDDSNAGVIFNLYKEAESVMDPETGLTVGFKTNDVIQVITNMVVAFPIHHGRSGTDDSYWSAIPQLEDGLQTGAGWTPDIGKAFIELPGDGLYRYTIMERPQTAILAPEEVKTVAQTVTEWFQLVNSGEKRGLYDVSGNIRYYGRILEDETVGSLVEPFAVDPDRDTVWRAVASTNDIARGSMSVRIQDENGDSVEVFNDSSANGILYVSGGTNTTAWSGTIDYETGEIEILFTKPLPSGRTPELSRKKFPVPLLLQAFKLADEAGTSVSVSGTPVYQEARETKGDFLVPNLEGGRYAIRAFLDSNGNGFADPWETQGVAVQTGTVSPNIDSGAAPIVVNDNVTGLMIVLHDRDTDNDLLPDAWEWWRFGNLLTSGYEPPEPGGLRYWQEYADGALDSDPRTPDTDLDGLTDAMEILVTKTDTHLKDTDGDGIGDLEEFLSGSNPLDGGSAIPYAVPALAFDEAGVPFVDIDYPALKPGVILTYELQRKTALYEDAWETVAEHEVANTGNEVLYSQYDGVNANMSAPGTARMLPADQAEGEDFTTGFYRIKVYADYGRMVDNGDGTWSYWTWVKTGSGSFTFKEAARGKGTLVRDANGNWSFVSDSTGRKGVLVRDENGNWKFQN